MPRIVIAVPVFNGAAHLHDCLDCLAGQTVDDFEVVVFNNGSTDASGDIAEDFAARDRRFRVEHRATTIPIMDNFRHAARSADCDYFAWRAADDRSAPNYVETLARALDADPQAGLAVCEVRTYWEGTTKRRIRPVPALTGNRLVDTVNLMFRSRPSWVYGLYRHGELARNLELALDGYGEVWGGDHALLFPFIARHHVLPVRGTHFIHGITADRLHPHRPPVPAAEQRRIFARFYRYCAERLAENGFGPASKAVLRAVLVVHAHRRTFHLTRIAKRMAVEFVLARLRGSAEGKRLF